MATDIREIELTEEQKRRIAELAERSGCSWGEVLADRLGEPESDDRYIEDPEEWHAYFREWLSKQTSRNPNFDDSRESIYD